MKKNKILTIGQGIPKKTMKEKHGVLRKIVREFLDKGIPYEQLECGHVIMQKRDIYGFTNAYRRRCWKCRNLGITK